MIEEAQKMIATILKFEYIEDLRFFKSGLITAKVKGYATRQRFSTLLELVEEAKNYDKHNKKQ